MVQIRPGSDNFVFSSSVEAESWHPGKERKAYEWWYFDALSDDGREALVIVFLDNFIYSPRYNGPAVTDPHAGKMRFPAVSFTYYKDGKQVLKAKTEYSSNQFHADTSTPKCRIGESGFRFESASYGNGYLVSVDLALSRSRRLRADLEWLSIESDYREPPSPAVEAAHKWNLVAPRSDVSGKIIIEDPRGRAKQQHSFRGTGYHDHNLDNRWLARSVKDWHWGRAHFTDATAVFCRFSTLGGDAPYSKLILIRDGRLTEHGVDFREAEHSRNLHGLKYPQRLTAVSQEGFHLECVPVRTIDASFYFLRFLSEIRLVTDDGKEHSTTGISEFIAPWALKYRWLNWLADLRTGKNGKAPII